MDDPVFESWQGQDFFLLRTSSRLALGPTQPSTQSVLGFIPRGKAIIEWCWTLTSN